jgi:hypothetical protein
MGHECYLMRSHFLRRLILKRSFLLGSFAAATSLVAGAALFACGSSTTREAYVEDAGVGETGPGFQTDGGDRPTACKGIQCDVAQCSGATKTTLTGKVVAPTPSQYGAPDPIYNAILYVPNAELAPFPEGVSCDKCGAVTSGEPIVTALSNPDGTFTLEGVPSGKDIPLVIQVGRWRRLVKIPSVESCVETKLDLEATRLPRNKAEGDIPLMAIATSPYDPTECILRKIGIDESEFTVPSGDGRVHIYKGMGATLAGATPPSSSTLWATPASLQKYDLVAFPCQTSGGPDTSGKSNIKQYADTGGRVFVTDLSEDIIQNGPAGWPGTAAWGGGGAYTNPAHVDTTFPKGQALADWLDAIGATPTKGQFDLQNTFARLTAANAPAQRWIYSASTTQTYSFNTPVDTDAADQCGRVVYSSFHIATGAGSSFPSECSAAPLTTQEKVLEFLLFDLAACIQKDDAPPAPPPVVK